MVCNVGTFGADRLVVDQVNWYLGFGRILSLAPLPPPCQLIINLVLSPLLRRYQLIRLCRRRWPPLHLLTLIKRLQRQRHRQILLPHNLGIKFLLLEVLQNCDITVKDRPSLPSGFHTSPVR